MPQPGVHFSWSEFGTNRSGDLPLRYRPAVNELVDRYLTPLRRRFGRVTVHSGHRTREHNAAVGGAPNSFHIYSEHPDVAAADVSCQRGNARQWAAFLERLDRPPGGLGVYSSSIHVDTRSGRARW